MQQTAAAHRPQCHFKCDILETLVLKGADVSFGNGACSVAAGIPDQFLESVSPLVT